MCFKKRCSPKNILLKQFILTTIILIHSSTHKLADHKLEDIPSLTIKLALKILNLYIIGIAWYSLDFLISEKEAGFSTNAPKIEIKAYCIAGVSFTL